MGPVESGTAPLILFLLLHLDKKILLLSLFSLWVHGPHRTRGKSAAPSSFPSFPTRASPLSLTLEGSMGCIVRSIYGRCKCCRTCLGCPIPGLELEYGRCAECVLRTKNAAFVSFCLCTCVIVWYEERPSQMLSGTSIGRILSPNPNRLRPSPPRILGR